jgi:hypothetical protein
MAGLLTRRPCAGKPREDPDPAAYFTREVEAQASIDQPQWLNKCGELWGAGTLQ